MVAQAGPEETDPGVAGGKLSKSGGMEEVVAARNKSYGKVLDVQIAWLRLLEGGDAGADEMREKWLAKSQWHESAHGW